MMADNQNLEVAMIEFSSDCNVRWTKIRHNFPLWSQSTTCFGIKQDMIGQRTFKSLSARQGCLLAYWYRVIPRLHQLRNVVVPGLHTEMQFIFPQIVTHW